MTAYFDHTATGLVDPELVDFYAQALRDYPYNPAANYSEAKRGLTAINKASEEIGRLLGCRAEEVIYTSSGTESINTALKSVGWQTRPKAGQIVAPLGEHPASAETLNFLDDKLERTCNYVPLVDGRPDLSLFEESLATHKTDLITCMAVSNLTGAIYPVGEIQKLKQTYAPQARFHIDAVQALGKIPISFRDWGVDYMSFSLHKLGAPKGLGILLARNNLPLEPLLLGGGQQGGKRSSTENPAQALTSAFAIKKSLDNLAAEEKAANQLKDKFLAKIDALGLDYKKLSPEESVPQILALYIPGLRSQNLQTVLADQGLLVGIGSACSSAKAEVVSQVKALGLNGEPGYHLLRVSFNSRNSEAEASALAESIYTAVDRFGLKQK
ncbi:MAG: aminotransferase class V-fold PLP-dependent enzyme [Eubacteriales bacterium]|nr:aminotransferase class V-fold PLP-dependent enzyme [Eubacteriales bacterium]